MDVYDRIEKMLIRFLAAEKGITAISANFGGTEGPYDDGCDTCGYGSTGMTFEINYKTATDKYGKTISMDGDPLGFFPTLLEYDE